MKFATAASYLGILEKCLKQLGIEDFLRHLNFDPSKIVDPNAYLSFDEFEHIINEAYRLSGCPYLGLIFGEHLSIANHGFLGYAALTSPTLHAAITTMLNFLNTRTGLLRGVLHENRFNQAWVEFELLTHNLLINRFITELAVVHLARLSGFLINANNPCFRVDAAYPSPPYSEYYRQFLNIPVKFNAKVTRVWFKAHDLHSPMSFADDASYQQAKNQLQTLSKQLSEEKELPTKIKNILRQSDNLQLSMGQVASKLFLSARTLRRRLQSYNVHYQDLLNEIREQKAKELLTENNHTITEICFMLGFNDVSNFSKAFKRWTSLTPREYRKKSNITNP